MPRAAAALLLAVTLAITLAACAAAPPARRADRCTMERVAALPLHDARNFMLAPVRVNGRAALFVVDTGAEASTLTPQAAAALHLPSDPGRSSVLLGISGPVRTHSVRVHRMEIGDVIRTDQILGLGEMPAFPGQHLPVVGLLGTDVLAQYEVELDLPDGRMSLYALHDCPGFTPWPDAVTVPFARTRTGLAFVDAVVNGSTVRALLDTGARTTLLARETAASLGVSAAALADDPPRVGIGIGMGNVDFRQHRFAELGLPGAIERNMPANVAEMRLPGVAMLLGADYLGPRRIWISYATGRLFLR